MKIRSFILSAMATLTLASCSPWESETVSFTKYKPTLIDRTDLEKSVKYVGPQRMLKPGKIYFFGNYIFISEQFKGIHIIDNSVPENPAKVGFISVLGCMDIAVKGNMLYADNAVDMVCIDISNISAPKEVNRVKNAFPEIYPPDGLLIPEEYTASNRPKNTVIIDWN